MATTPARRMPARRMSSTPPPALLHTLDNPTPASEDYFGSSVAVSGTTVVVGAYQDDTGAADAGSAYVFDAATGTLLRTLNNVAPATGDAFGYSVAVSGSMVVVGAYAVDAGATDAGSAYIFDVTSGALLRTLNNPVPASEDYFGSSVAVSGNTVVVGTPQDDTGVSNAGSAYVYDAATGNLLKTLPNPAPADGDQFGYGVAVSGDLAVVGGPYVDGGSIDRGAVYLFGVNRTPTGAELLAASDTGVSSTDNVTCLNNSTAGNRLQFAVTNTIAGATVTIYADGSAIGSVTATGTTTTVTTNGACDLADGPHSITARQTEPGNPESADSPTLPITIDTATPLADVVDVSPDPRTTSVSTIPIVFSEPVYGFDLADLKLTRNGTNVALTAATLTTTDNVTWTLGNLGGLTGTLVGATTTNYLLTLTAAGSGITDTAGNALAANATDAWQLQPTSFTGTANADTFEFIAAGAVGGLPTMHQLKLTLGGSPVVTYLYDASGSVALTLRGGLSNDTLQDHRRAGHGYVQHLPLCHLARRAGSGGECGVLFGLRPVRGRQLGDDGRRCRRRDGPEGHLVQRSGLGRPLHRLVLATDRLDGWHRDRQRLQQLGEELRPDLRRLHRRRDRRPRRPLRLQRERLFRLQDGGRQRL